MLTEGLRGLLAALLVAASCAAGAESPRANLLLYCGITMVRPMTEIARNFEQRENVRITMAQGGSEDLYQSAKRSGLGDLYLPGEPSYRDKHRAEGLFGQHVVVGYNQMAIMVQKGNPKKVKPDPKELLRKDLVVMIGNAESGSVGNEAKALLDSIGLYPKVVAKAIALLPDSRALNNAMKRGEADATLNWRATAFFPDNLPALDVVDLDPRLAKPQPLLLIPLTLSRQTELVRKFMDYAASPEGQAIFRKHGFLDNRMSAAH